MGPMTSNGRSPTSVSFLLSAPPRSAPLRSAHLRSAPLRSAPPRYAPPRSAPLRYAPPRYAPPRFAHCLTAFSTASLNLSDSHSNNEICVYRLGIANLAILTPLNNSQQSPQSELLPRISPAQSARPT